MQSLLSPPQSLLSPPLLLVLLSTLVSSVAYGANQHHRTPTYFHRRQPDGQLVDRANEQAFNKPLACLSSPMSTHTLAASGSNGTIHVYPEVIENGQLITLVWKVDTPASYKDWIGYFCGKNTLLNYPNNIDYFHVPVSPTWEQGTGSYSVKVYNMRQDCELRYYKPDSEGHCHLAAQSPVLKFKGGPADPLHGHIAFGNDASEMRAMWTSGTTATPVVLYGLSPSSLLSRKFGSSSTYGADDMCHYPATTVGFVDPGYLHKALLTGLKPHTRYFYQYGSSEGMSEIRNFTTAMEVGDSTPFTFITFGDQGVSQDRMSPGADSTAANIMKEYRENNNLSLIFHHGDLSYAVGYAYLWEQWHALIEPYATAIPYMVGTGNHEQDHSSGGDKDPSGAPGDGFHPSWGNFGGDSGGECGVPVYYRFHMPDNGNKVWWYSFDYGLVHFVMMSTEHNYTKGSLQRAWLENDLKFLDRKRTPWVVLGGHRPMYTTQSQYADQKVASNMQDLLEDLLHEHQVDLALWSHVHSYQRMCKVYKRECRDDGTVHVVVGSAGRTLDPQWFDDVPTCLFKRIRFGYGKVHVANATHMKYEFLDNEDRQAIDYVWLTK